MTEVGEVLEMELARQESALDALVSENLAQLNELASDLAMPFVLPPKADRQ